MSSFPRLSCWVTSVTAHTHNGVSCVWSGYLPIHNRIKEFHLFNSLCHSQVPKTSVNLDGDVRKKFMCHPSILTQGSQEWWVSQISTSKILHSGPNFR